MAARFWAPSGPSGRMMRNSNCWDMICLWAITRGSEEGFFLSFFLFWGFMFFRGSFFFFFGRIGSRRLYVMDIR